MTQTKTHLPRPRIIALAVTGLALLIAAPFLACAPPSSTNLTTACHRVSVPASADYTPTGDIGTWTDDNLSVLGYSDEEDSTIWHDASCASHLPPYL
jgi:hypothetical protein